MTIQLDPIPKFTGPGGVTPVSTGDWNSLWKWLTRLRVQVQDALNTVSSALLDHTTAKTVHGYKGTIANSDSNPGAMSKDTYLIYVDMLTNYRYWVWCDGENRYGSGIDPVTGTAHVIIWDGLV